MSDPNELSAEELHAQLPTCPQCGRPTLAYRENPIKGAGSTTPRRIIRIFECTSPLGAIPRCRFRSTF